MKAGLQDLFLFHFVPFQEGDGNEASFLFTAYSQNPELLLRSNLHLTRVKNQPDFKAEIKDCSKIIYFKKKKKKAKLGAIHPCFCLLSVGAES